MRAILVRTGKYRPGDEELCRPAPLAVVDCNLGSNGETLVTMGCNNHEILGCFFGGVFFASLIRWAWACYWVHAALEI